MRVKLGINVLWSDRKSLLRDMIKVLRNNGLLGFVMDQKPEGRVGHKVQFLGYPASFVSGPARLTIRNRCPVVAVFCIRKNPWKYEIIHKEILSADHSLEDEYEITKRMATEIENMVRTYPEQWTWSYKRWKFDR